MTIRQFCRMVGIPLSDFDDFCFMDALGWVYLAGCSCELKDRKTGEVVEPFEALRKGWEGD